MEERKYAPNYKLRRARELKGWTQRDVADHIDLPDARTLRRWECGDSVPSLRYRAKLCEIFEMSSEELGLIVEPSTHLLEKSEMLLETVHASEMATETPFTLQALHTLEQTVSTPNYWNRQRLLKKVFAFWIKDILEPSFAHTPRLALTLQAQLHVVLNPWHHVVQPERQISPLAPETTLLDVYDDACGELLLLGETGSGKTILLLELARKLLQRAFEQNVHPIPVIFTLASWEEKRLPIADWLVEELCAKYQVPQRIALEWVKNDHILPLVDSFDAVSPPLRKYCLQEINAYRQIHGLTPFVLCSQKEAYCDLMETVMLQQAVCIQALSLQQIDEYFVKLAEPLDILRCALQDDEELLQFVRTPRILHLLVAACQGQSLEKLTSLASAEERRKHVLATYVEYALSMQNVASTYSIKQSIYWLTYLARQMKSRCQREIRLEHLHIDWLQPFWQTIFACLQVIVLTGAFLLCMVPVLNHGAFGIITLQSRSSDVWLLFLGCLSFWWTNMLAGFVCRALENHLLIKIKQGARSSRYIALRDGSVAAALYGGLLVLMSTILSQFSLPLGNELPGYFVLSLAVGAMIGLKKTCAGWMRHRLLRGILWLRGYAPWNYSNFLDYAAEHVLLCRVGEGYSFPHHLLLDYFASRAPDTFNP